MKIDDFDQYLYMSRVLVNALVEHFGNYKDFDINTIFYDTENEGSSEEYKMVRISIVTKRKLPYNTMLAFRKSISKCCYECTYNYERKPDEKKVYTTISVVEPLSHGCGTCKHHNKPLSAEPCDSCNIRLGNPRWEAKDG